MRSSVAATICLCVLALLLQPVAGEDSNEMTEEQVAAARDEALSKLEKPLEKMKIKDLMVMLEERGLECKNCQGAEKSVIVGQVRDAIHLPKKGKKDKGKKEKEDKKKEDKKDKAEKAAEPSVEMTEEQVAAARDEALSKLEKPLEKMKIKELMALLEERSVECKDCQGAEKSVIVGQVRDAMHLPKKSQEKRDKENKDKQKKEKDDKKKQDQKDKEQKKKKQEQEEAHAAVEMTEEEVAAAREEALGKLETPLEKMKIKDLLKLLEERGVECKNCKGAEKAHIVSQVREAIHLPKKSKGSKKKSEGKGGKKEDVDDIMSKLKGMPGMENIKVFGREDMDKMMKDGKYDL